MKAPEEKSVPRPIVRRPENRSRFKGSVKIAILICVTVFAVRELSLLRAVNRWNDLQATSKVAGDELTSRWKAEAVADDDNFAADPWIAELMRSDQSYGAAVLEDLDGSKINGDYEYWEAGQPSWFSSNPAERQKMILAGKAHAGDLGIIRAAAARPKCLLPGTPSLTDPEWSNRITRLTAVPRALALHADAALADGRTGEGVDDLVALLRMGNHLQSQHALLPMVIGLGIEGRAQAMIENSLQAGLLSNSEKERLLEACRTRPMADELSDTLRGERTMFLASMDVVASEFPGPAAPWEGRFWTNIFTSPDESLAANRYAYCKVVGPALTSHPGPGDWQRWADETKNAGKDLPKTAGIAGAALSLQSPIVSGTLVQEAEFLKLRKRLAE